MRLLVTLKNKDETENLSSYLSQNGVTNEVDGGLDKDWGSADYGTPVYKVWVIEEDQFDKSYALYSEFLKNPPPKSILRPIYVPKQMPSRTPLPLSAKTPITNFLVALCILLFVVDTMTAPKIPNEKAASTLSPLFASETKKELLYDYPKTFELLSALEKKYGFEALETPQTLPPEGQKLVIKLNDTPYWQGLYEKALAYFIQGKVTETPPQFEKIREGEAWRLFSPIFLHGDIFHLMFNMIWLYVLGRQVEINLKAARYIVFILLTAAFSNTAQYIMSGPNFIGFSGVLCAMLTFIWRRQIEAPWERYQLERPTFIFMMIFILGMAGLQTISFVLEAATGANISTSIANTAHLSGALAGLALSKIPFFTRDKTS